jgi:uncharacterized membrane protein YfcA
MLEAITAPWHLIVAGGFGIGFLVGMTGVGAGALTTPLLITGVGLSPVVAVGTDLLFAALTKAGCSISTTPCSAGSPRAACPARR